MSKQERQKRYFGLDVHKAYIMIAAVNADQEVVVKPRRVTFERFENWMDKVLRAGDEVVLEATTNAWHVHDLLAPNVAKVIVAHPYHVKLIAAAAVKTDKRDALALAKLLAAHMIPPVWVPPHHVRDLLDQQLLDLFQIQFIVRLTGRFFITQIKIQIQIIRSTSVGRHGIVIAQI